MLTRRTLGAGAVVALALTAALTVPGGPAVARAPGAECPPGQASCDVWEHLPGDPGAGDGGSTNPGGGSGGGDRVCEKDDGTVVPCYDELRGWFNSADDCYYKRHEPQPPGVEAGKTAYLRTCDGPPAFAEEVFLTDPPGGFDPPDPREMADDLLAGLDLSKPVLRIAPGDAPGLVGVPVWLFDASSWESLEDEASSGGVTVSIEAIPTKIEWDMGNGETVTCESPGIPFRAGTDPRRIPADACAYRGYPRSSQGRPDGGRYQITATKYWTVPWSSSTTGDQPPLSAETTADTFIRIDELQVVTR